MWKLTCFEFQKWLRKPFLLAVLLFSLLLHATVCYFLLLLPNSDGYSCVEEARMWDRLQAGTTRQRAEKAALLREDLQNADFLGMEQADFTHWYAQYSLVDKMLAQLQDGLDYPAFLQDVAAQSQRLQSSTLLSSASSYSSREIIQLASDYAELKAQVLPVEASTGVEALTQSSVTDVFVFLWGMALALSLFISEKRDGQFDLLKTSPRGKALLLAKWVAGIWSFLLLFALFYGSRLFLVQSTVGLGRLDRPIQTVSAYYKCTLPLSVGEFLGLFLGAKLGALTALTVLMAGVAAILPNVSATVLASMAAVGIEGVLYFQIDRYAWNGVWKEFNLFAMVDTSHYFTSGIYIPILGAPVSAGILALAAGGSCFLLGVALSCWFWWRITGVSPRLSPPWKMVKRTKAHPSLVWQEARKLFLHHHALPLFFLLCGLLAVCNRGTAPGSMVELYYQRYSDVLSGPLSAEKQAFLDQEAQRFQDADAKMKDYQEQFLAGDLSQEALDYYLAQLRVPEARLAAFEQAERQYQALTRLQASGKPVQYLYETGWARLFGPDGQRQDQVNSLLLCIFLILVVGSSRCRAFSTGMASLERTTPSGMRSRFTHLALCALLGGLAALAAYLFQIALLGIPLPGWSSMECSIEAVTALGVEPQWSLSLFGYLLLQGFFRATRGALSAALIWCVASVLKTIEATFLLSSILLLLPEALGLLNF